MRAATILQAVPSPAVSQAPSEDEAALAEIAEKVRQASSLLCLAHNSIPQSPAADAVGVADDLLATIASMLEDLALSRTAVPSAATRLATLRG